MSTVEQNQELELLASGLDPAELAEVREWFCYTKPMGPSLRIVATPASGGFDGFGVVAAGNQAGACEETCTKLHAAR